MGFPNSNASIYNFAVVDGCKPQLCDAGTYKYVILRILTDRFLQGESKSTKEVLKRIDYGGTVTIFGTVRVSTSNYALARLYQIRYCHSSSF